ncbi:hypothetical protein Tsubulata_049654, partial [Turnera subulata]
GLLLVRFILESYELHCTDEGDGEETPTESGSPHNYSPFLHKNGIGRRCMDATTICKNGTGKRCIAICEGCYDAVLTDLSRRMEAYGHNQYMDP